MNRNVFVPLRTLVLEVQLPPEVSLNGCLVLTPLISDVFGRVRGLVRPVAVFCFELLVHCFPRVDPVVL